MHTYEIQAQIQVSQLIFYYGFRIVKSRRIMEETYPTIVKNPY